MPSRVDLHTHTTASDGTLTPQALVSKAAELGVRVLAISDHDTTAGYDAVMASGAHPADLRLIPAIELNAEGEFSCHLLGYFIDPAQPAFQLSLAFFRERRTKRIRAMAQKLAALGVPIDIEAVLARSPAGSVGRPHLADALIAAGTVRSRQEAFDRFLKKRGPAYIAEDTPTAAESIALIRSAGGIPVLAHPSYYTSDALLKALVQFGLGGIEAYYPEHSRSLIERYREMAAAHGLVVTGGSDYHGPKTGRSALACVDVPESVVQALEEARSRS
jgi:3',5'-nucleoside bisphosphate phosphatase